MPLAFRGRWSSALSNQRAATQCTHSAVGFTNKKHLDKGAEQLPVVTMSHEKCQPEHFTLTDKESGAVCFLLPPPTGCRRQRRTGFTLFLFSGFKRTNFIRAVEYEHIHLRSLHPEHKLEATGLFSPLFGTQ